MASLARNTSIVAAGTLLSRVLGVVRDQVLAATFSTAWTDLFFDAFVIPNALRGLLAEGAVNSALLPVYAQVRSEEGDEAAKRFYASFRGAMMALLALVSIVGVLAARPLAHAYGDGFASDPERFEAFVGLTRIVFPYIFFMGVAALGAGLLNAHERFAVAAAAPALLNVAFVVAPFAVPVVIGLGWPPVYALGAAVLLGGALQMIAQWPSLAQIGAPTWPRFDLGDPRVRRALALLLPLTLGLGIYQLNVMLSRQFASYLPEGALSYLYYAQRFVEIPQGMFAVAISSAAIPALTALRAKGDHAGVLRTYHEALSLGLFIALPISALLVVLGHPLLVVLLQRGHFDAEDAIQAGASLAAQSAGVWAVASVRVTVPVFYAYGQTRKPLWGSAANLATFAIVAALLARTMGHVGIAVAISVAGVVQLVVLVALLRRELGPLGLGKVVAGAWRTAVASGLAALVGAMIARLGHWERGGNDLGNVAVLGGSLAAAGVVFLGVAALLGTPELARARGAVERRLRRR